MFFLRKKQQQQMISVHIRVKYQVTVYPINKQNLLLIVMTVLPCPSVCQEMIL